MQLVLHLGAHGTDNGLIAAWIERNRTLIEAQGACAPDPRVFVQNVSQALDRDRDMEPLAREEALLRGLGASGARRWMMVSAPGLLGGRDAVISPEGFYTKDVARRMYALHTLFPRCQITIMLAVRAADGLLPQILPQDPEAMSAAMQMLGGETLHWALLAGTIRRHLPRANLVVWRHEKLARAWPEVMAHLIGPGRTLPPAGLLEFAKLGLSAEATERLRRYLVTSPPATAGQLKKIAEVFGNRYGHAATNDRSAEYPGWVQVEIERLTQGYTTEWADIVGRDGVTMLR